MNSLSTSIIQRDILRTLALKVDVPLSHPVSLEKVVCLCISFIFNCHKLTKTSPSEAANSKYCHCVRGSVADFLFWTPKKKKAILLIQMEMHAGTFVGGGKQSSFLLIKL